MRHTPEQLAGVLCKIAQDLPDTHGSGGAKLMLQEIGARVSVLVEPWDEDVERFHIKFRHPAPCHQLIPRGDVMSFRIKLIREECDELCEAIEARDLGRIAQEAVDVVYVVLGTLIVCGLRFKSFFNLVHRANMAKVHNPDGGKPIKLRGWVKPDCSALIDDNPIDMDPMATERGYN